MKKYRLSPEVLGGYTFLDGKPVVLNDDTPQSKLKKLYERGDKGIEVYEEKTSTRKKAKQSKPKTKDTSVERTDTDQPDEGHEGQ